MNDYSNFKIIKPQGEKDETTSNKFAENINYKKFLIIGIIVVLSGVLIGGILKIKTSNNNLPAGTPQGQVEGELTMATTIASNSPTPTASPTVRPKSTLDPNLEGAELATDTPIETETATPTTTPTPTPTTAPIYNASISSVSSNGNLSATIIVNVTKNNSADCGESVSLVSSPTGVTFSSNNDCSDGNTTFSATATNAGTYTITSQVYGQPYGTSQLVF